ncbi:unnamed protein product (macronuclear) [Paramecium tetraurelia]|uniref:EGF-like domain-containing protein n=1 Tax=Paramecium tetraurelia TaxID=5888 RepID=A0BPI4_PARTE|nr:uncharacterized protein GSPATT00005200001 [Paramecium tetraurelia]CAK60451.1 unnamed protein product [Paramecium tetraurelia]|eukprot:XP_001427849.1 hypothetical protein (macronuclear) [Paramecium tetraurelia strain d4-2]
MKQLISCVFGLLMILCIRGNSQMNYKLSEGSKQKLEESKPKIASLPWEPIRIHYEFLDSSYDSESVKFLSTVLDITNTFFSKHLLIQRTDSKLTYKRSYPNSIYGFTISETLKNKEYDADLVFFINVEDTFFESYLAYCGPITFNEQTLRPTFALISWNIFYSGLDEMTNTVFEGNVETAVHEIIHGLGFTDDFFNTYYDSITGNSYKSSNSFTTFQTIFLSTPRVTNFAQYHFNCTTLKGLQMENNGGSGTQGSHLERSLFYNEIMTGSDMIGNFLITDFTFELLQDTGFYRVADYSPDQPLWGKNKGCDFANQQCKGGNFTEFCTQDKSSSCSFYNTGVSECQKEQLSGSCSYYYINDDQDCRDPDNIAKWKSSDLIQYFGYDSMCVSGSVSKQQTYKNYSCVQYKCDLNNKLSLVIAGQEYDCSKSDSIKLPEQYYGNITCPTNSQTFCQNRDECPNLCSQKGFCMNKECTCMQGYSSPDCSVECTKYRYKGSCLDKCPDSTYVNENIKYCLGCPANCLTCSNYNQCTQCKLGYVLRGAFCDNFKLTDLLTFDLTTINEASNTSTTNSTNTETNSTDINNNNSTSIDKNSTETASNSTELTSNSTEITSNSTEISSNSTEITSNSTETIKNTTDIKEDAPVNNADLIYLMNIFLFTYF